MFLNEIKAEIAKCEKMRNAMVNHPTKQWPEYETLRKEYFDLSRKIRIGMSLCSHWIYQRG